jgi:hypothetical protein
MNWYKAYHGLPCDARLAVVARKAQIRRAEAVALWVALLDRASRQRPRGTVGSPDPEELGEMLDISPEDTARALQAFRDKGLLTQTGAIGGWDKMQATSTRRVRAHRRRQKEQSQRRAQEQPPEQPSAALKKTAPAVTPDDTLPENPFALAPPPPDDPAEIARRRLRLQRRFQAKRRPPAKPGANPPPRKGDRP